MMRISIWAIAGSVLLSAFLFPMVGHTEEPAPRVLILYHDTPIKQFDQNVLKIPVEPIMLTNLIGHFNPKIARVPIDKYVPGLLKRYDVVFYIGNLKENKIPEAFLDDIPKYPTTSVVWLRWNIQQLLERHPEAFKFRILSQSGGFNSITYNKQVYSRVDNEQVLVAEILDRKNIKTYGIFLSDSGFAPFAIHARNLWFVSDSIYYGVSNLVFADILHEIFQQPHKISSHFFVRLEDIHPMREPSRLRNICEELYEESVPFMMAVTPVYKQPGKKIVYMKERPHLVKVLKDCASMGGAILLHGYTHQWKNESGEGYEFWDVPNDRPIEEYTEQIIHEKMRKGIRELASLGLYPVAWETPHYAAGERSLSIISQYFSIAVEQRQVSNESYTITQSVPYLTKDIYGFTLLTENLGYVSLEQGEDPDKKIQNAKPYSIVRDSLVGFFYHPYFKPKYLMQVIKGLKDLGYSPFDLRQVPGVVLGDEHTVFTGLDQYEIFKPTEKMVTLDGNARMLKVKMKNEWLRSFLLNENYEPLDERWKLAPDGQALVLVPDRENSMFVVETSKKRPSPIRRFMGKVHGFIIGDTSNQVETVQRWVVWFFFGLTIVFVGIILKIFISRTSYHESHFRKKHKDKE